jgi:release factor glutamine methyltransferase
MARPISRVSSRQAREPDATVACALRWAAGVLAGSDTASLDAQLLLGEVLDRGRAWVLAHGDAPVEASELPRFEDLVRRRALGEPVAYLRRLALWRDLELRVGPGVLVPRPETELLVDVAIELAVKRCTRSIVDVGTGSGAIAIALALALPDARISAIEQSDPALQLARENIERYGLKPRIELRRGDLLRPIGTEPEMVVANLPYLSSERMTTLPRDVQFEPVEALDGGETGLIMYERLVRSLTALDWEPDLVFEIDPEQEDAMTALLSEGRASSPVHFVRDLAGRNRIAVRESARGDGR